jgi:hypothetical protein
MGIGDVGTGRKKFFLFKTEADIRHFVFLGILNVRYKNVNACSECAGKKKIPTHVEYALKKFYAC